MVGNQSLPPIVVVAVDERQVTAISLVRGLVHKAVRCVLELPSPDVPLGVRPALHHRLQKHVVSCSVVGVDGQKTPVNIILSKIRNRHNFPIRVIIPIPLDLLARVDRAEILGVCVRHFRWSITLLYHLLVDILILSI